MWGRHHHKFCINFSVSKHTKLFSRNPQEKGQLKLSREGTASLHRIKCKLVRFNYMSFDTLAHIFLQI